MAIRKCPQCLTVVSPGFSVAFSDSLECTGCHAPLTVSEGSRRLAVIGGLAAATLTWRLTATPGEGTIAWALAVLYPFLSFSFVTPLLLMTFADLRNREPEIAFDESAHAADSHGGHD